MRRRPGGRLGALAALAVILAACGDEEPVRPQLSEPWPERLGEWGLFVGEPARLVSNRGVLPYDLNTPLFSDYALKYRTVWMPEGRSGRWSDRGPLELPVGTILSKTFYYRIDPDHAGRVRIGTGDAGTDRATGGPDRLPGDPGTRRLIETRLLVHAETGWVALPYVWNEAQTEATLEIAGDLQGLAWTRAGGGSGELTYLVPNRDQCASCHVSHAGFERTLRPIGPSAANLNRDYAYAGGRRNQLERWRDAGYLTGGPSPARAPRLPVWDDPETGNLDARARAYLEVQCAHCHAETGPADASGLLLGFHERRPLKRGLCKTPVAAGRGSGDRRYDVVPGRPDESILLFRMASREPDVMMPELGRDLRHEEGLALIRRWIASLEGTCATGNRVG